MKGIGAFPHSEEKRHQRYFCSSNGFRKRAV